VANTKLPFGGFLLSGLCHLSKIGIISFGIIGFSQDSWPHCNFLAFFNYLKVRSWPITKVSKINPLFPDWKNFLFLNQNSLKKFAVVAVKKWGEGCRCKNHQILIQYFGKIDKGCQYRQYLKKCTTIVL
jgi:hypothetical protein